MSTVWTHIEYGWDLNAEVSFEATKGEVDNSIAIDGIDMLSAVVLVELARQPLERDHARSVEEVPRCDVGVVVVVAEIGTFAEARVRTAIGPKQENPPGSGEQQKRDEPRDAGSVLEVERPGRERRAIGMYPKQSFVVPRDEFPFAHPELGQPGERVMVRHD